MSFSDPQIKGTPENLRRSAMWMLVTAGVVGVVGVVLMVVQGRPFPGVLLLVVAVADLALSFVVRRMAATGEARANGQEQARPGIEER